MIFACFTIKKTVVASTVKRRGPPLLEKERGGKTFEKTNGLKVRFKSIVYKSHSVG